MQTSSLLVEQKNKNTFNRELDDFLSEYGISKKTTIFTDVVMQIAGVSKDPNADQRTLVFDVPYFYPKGFLLEDLNKLFYICDFNYNDYRTDQPIVIKWEKLAELFSKFKDKVKDYDASELRNYRINSKPIIEAEVTATIKSDADLILKSLNQKKYKSLTNKTHLTNLMKELLSICQKTNHHPFTTCLPKLEAYTTQNPLINEDHILSKRVNSITKALKKYTNYCHQPLTNSENPTSFFESKTAQAKKNKTSGCLPQCLQKK